VLIDGVVLAGGRSQRLGGEPKAALRFRGRTLLDIALDSLRPTRRVIVVGDPATLGELPATVIAIREDPPFGGPAAGLGAGLGALAHLGGESAEFTMVIGCDMPLIGRATGQLLLALRERMGSGDDAEADGVIGMANGQLQPLAAVYRTSALQAALDSLGPLDGQSLRAITRQLQLVEVPLHDGSTDDVDTWDDAARFDIRSNSSLAHPDSKEEIS
jgi:molybdopterin-guanine dinucleotide biosynthesis protein A